MPSWFSISFHAILQVSREIDNSGGLLGEPKYNLPSFSNTIIDSRSLPLAYSHHRIKQNLEPNPNVLCDFPSCNNESNSEITWLACFHTCHLNCLERNEMLCPFCKDLFLTRVNKSNESFNNGLIEHDMSSNVTENHNGHEQPESQPEVHTSRTSDFYKSHDWENMITRNLAQIPHIPQPSVPHWTQEGNK